MRYACVAVAFFVIGFCTIAGATAAAAQPDAAAAPPAWITAKNKPCKLWNPQPQAHESVTWSGGCKDGLADGKGTVQWTEDGKRDAKFVGAYAAGKRNGPGLLITPDGHSIPGQWSDDELVVGDSNAI